jgi:hypothetical protein
MAIIKMKQVVAMSGPDSPQGHQDVLINTDTIVIVVPAADLTDRSHEVCTVVFANGKSLFFEGTVDDFHALIKKGGVDA